MCKVCYWTLRLPYSWNHIGQMQHIPKWFRYYGISFPRYTYTKVINTNRCCICILRGKYASLICHCSLAPCRTVCNNLGSILQGAEHSVPNPEKVLLLCLNSLSWSAKVSAPCTFKPKNSMFFLSDLLHSHIFIKIAQWCSVMSLCNSCALLISALEPFSCALLILQKKYTGET